MCGIRSQLSWWMWMGCSIAVAIAAVATALCWNGIINALVSSILVLSPGSETYSRWVAPDQPLVFEVFMFNWTNADNFPKEKPKLEQIGPYRFREVRKHVNVTFHPHNSSVAYRTQRSWFFDNTTSNGSLQDIVVSISMTDATAKLKLKDPKLAGPKWFYSRSGRKLSVKKTVGEMLFEGYEDGILILYKFFLERPKGAPKPDGRFGWFHTINNSIDTDGYVEVSSGADGTLLGQILKWNHEESLPFYKGSCSKLAGSVGEFITRNLTANSTLTMFVPDLCRTVNLEYVDTGVLNGLDYHKFEMGESCFDKSSSSDENTCFCNGDCIWTGVMNVSACRFDAPIFLSLPHFLYGDPKLREDVEGMEPDPEKHSFYFAVEPTLGVPIDVAGRFQLNVYLEIDKQKMLFPVFWVQQHVIVTDRIFTELKVFIWVSRWGGIVFAVLGLICAAITIICSSQKPKYISISTG